MGARLLVLVGLLSALAQQTIVRATGHAPIGFVPFQLRHLFHPNETEDDAEHAGFVVERSRRASGVEDGLKEEEYTLHNLGGAPCIFAKTECTFYIEYHTLRHGVQTARVDLPKEPAISGSCVRDGDTAVLTMKWSVFNFSLIFTQNPEGNSYYLNTALLKFNYSLDLFRDVTYRGPVTLSTKKGWNYYFTPLGQSYVCRDGEDQGPLSLYNVDDEKVGNMTLYNTKFQPFVKRAKGKWGPENHCLPKATQIMREEIAPYVSSMLFLASICVMIVGYGLYRKFNVKKTDYEFYGEPGTEGHEMARKNAEGNEADMPPPPKTTTTQVRPAPTSAQQAGVAQNGAGDNGVDAAPTNNPFKNNKASSNPFQQQHGYGSAPV